MQFAYLPYLNLVMHFINLACQLLTAILFSRLIYYIKFKSKNLRVKELSFSMQIYLYTHILGCVLSLAYQSYMLLAWRVPVSELDAVYQPYVIYWLSLWQITYLAVSSVPVVFLSVDRILAVKNVKQKIRNYILVASIGLLAVVFVGSMVFLLLELPLDIPKVYTCEVSACLMLRFRYLPQISAKIVFGCINLLFSCCLFYMTKEVNSSSTRVIKFMVTMEILLGDIPTVFGYVFNIITGVSAANFFGEFTFMFCVVESSLCATYYTLNIFKRRSEISLPASVILTSHKHVIPL